MVFLTSKYLHDNFFLDQECRIRRQKSMQCSLHSSRSVPHEFNQSDK